MTTRGSAHEAVIALPSAGSYTGKDPNYSVVDPVKFYVSGSRTQLQDISIPAVYLTCAPGGKTITDHLGIGSVTLKSDGSFSATTTQHGVYGGFPATFTYTFQGHFRSGGRAAGSFRETLAYTDSAARTCTSQSQPWTATRDAQPSQTTSPPPAGSYTGADPDYSVVDPVTFDVSGNRTQLQDISIPAVYLTCAPGGKTITDHLGIGSVTLKSDGSFSATTTQHGVYGGFPATFTYTFQGHFHSVGPSGAARAAGSFRETLAYTDTAARTCTSNSQLWAATLTST